MEWGSVPRHSMEKVGPALCGRGQPMGDGVEGPEDDCPMHGTSSLANGEPGGESRDHQEIPGMADFPILDQWEAGWRVPRGHRMTIT